MTRGGRWATAGAALALVVACGGSRSAVSTPDTALEPADTAVAVPADTAPPGVDEVGEVEDAAPTDERDVVDADAASSLASACRVEGGYRWLAVPEASGAARLDPEGDRVVIVGDSGSAGRALILDAATWEGTPTTLPVDDGASDDLEGLARAPDGRVVGLTSSGWFREWTFDGAVFTRTRSAYAGSTDAAWVCGRGRGNCGKNYEGLCLHPAPPPGACAGYAASKTAGTLVCVRDHEDGYRFDPGHVVTVVPDVSGEAEQGPLSACSFEPEPPYRLVVGGNVFTSSALWEVTGHDTPATATVTALAVSGAPNQEAIELVAGGRILSFGDVQNLSPDSPTLEIVCR